jgi:hypothetical protein
MISDSLKTAVKLMVSVPLIWAPGIVAGLAGAADLLIMYYLGPFIAERLLVIGLVVLPLFLAGMMYLIRTGEKDGRAFLKGATGYYFRILLPSILIGAAIMLTIGILALTLGIAGTGFASEMLGLVSIGTIVPVIFFTFFYDTAAVFEDTRIFESIRRSVEVVAQNLSRVIMFYIVSIVMTMLAGFALLIIWTGILYDRLEPLSRLEPADFSTFSIGDLNALLGIDGIWITAVIFFIGAAVLVTFIYAFKCCFYKNIAEKPAKVEVITGEFDSKGRFYKYT